MKRYENIERMNFEGAGEYGIPTIEPVNLSGDTEFIPFNYAASCKRRTGKSVHFLWMIINSCDCGMIRIGIYRCFHNFSMY